MSEPRQANESNGEEPQSPDNSSDVRNDPNNDFSGDDTKRGRPIPSRPGSSGKLGDQTGRAPQKSKHSDSSRRKEQGAPSEVRRLRKQGNRK